MPYFRIVDLMTAKNVLQSIPLLEPHIRIQRNLGFLYASTGKSEYDQIEYISGVYLPGERSAQSYFVDCYSWKQNQVSFSFVRAHIFATPSASDRRSLIEEAIGGNTVTKKSVHSYCRSVPTDCTPLSPTTSYVTKSKT